MTDDYDSSRPDYAETAEDFAQPGGRVTKQQTTQLAQRGSGPSSMADVGVHLSQAVVYKLVTSGDASELSDDQKLLYYKATCDAAGLDYRTQPFEFIKLNNRLILYAKKQAAAELCRTRQLSVTVPQRGPMDDEGIYEATAQVSDPSGRITEDVGAVFAGQSRGEKLANMRMKAVTKAKRRAVLTHCGLGMPDESEVADRRRAAAPVTATVVDDPLGYPPQTGAPLDAEPTWADEETD